jgi:addiction module HigA family antidote
MLTRNEYFPQSRPYPGKTLVEKLEEMGMSSKELAECIDRPEQTIIAVLNGKGAITPDLAVQFEKATRIPAHFWMNSQRNYDEFMARKKYKKNREVVLFES